MWWKVVLPLSLALILGLADWARRRIERHRDEFLRRVVRRIAERHRDFEVLGEEGMSLSIRLGPTDFRLKLEEPYRRAAADPARFEEILDAQLETVREALAAHENTSFEGVQNRILPQVKNRRFLDVNGELGEEKGIVWRPLADEIVITYVLDSPHGMTYLTRAHLSDWAKREEEIHEIALKNLRRVAARHGGRIDPKEGIQVVRTMDGYDASRVLILGELLKEPREDILVGLPDRDTLLVILVPADRRRAVAADLARRAPQGGAPAITRKLFRLTPSGIEPLE